MKPFVVSFLLTCLGLAPISSFAGPGTYLCKLRQATELSKDGNLVEHKGIFKQLLDESFTINRITGEMIGLPFSTEGWLGSVQVLNHGSSENGYKAIVVSGKPNVSAKYIYVAEQTEGPSKPFWGNGDDRVIFSGTCQ